jgi:hypothetical protein
MHRTIWVAGIYLLFAIFNLAIKMNLLKSTIYLILKVIEMNGLKEVNCKIESVDHFLIQSLS